MFKHKFGILTLLLGAAAMVWLSRNYTLVRIEPTPIGQIQSSTGPPGNLSDGGNATTGSPGNSADAKRQKEENRMLDMNWAVRDQEDVVEERRKVLATIVRMKGIIYRGKDSFFGETNDDQDYHSRNALQVYNQLAQEHVQFASLVESLMKYDDPQFMAYACEADLPDNAIKVLYPRYQQAKRELELLKKEGLGETDQSLLAKTGEVQSIEGQLREAVVNLRASLQARLELATDRLKVAEGMKNKEHEDAVKRGLDGEDYVDAKKDFEADIRLLEELKLKRKNLSIDQKIRR